MTTTTRATLQDRMDCIESYSSSDDFEGLEELLEGACTLEEEYNGLKHSLRIDTINEVAEQVLTQDYVDRDGYCDNRAWRRNVNIDMLAAGRLDRHSPNHQHLGGMPRMVTIGGVKYYSAV